MTDTPVIFRAALVQMCSGRDIAKNLSDAGTFDTAGSGRRRPEIDEDRQCTGGDQRIKDVH